MGQREKCSESIARHNYRVAYRLSRQLYKERDETVNNEDLWTIVQCSVDGLCMTYTGWAAWIARITRDDDVKWLKVRAGLWFRSWKRYGSDCILTKAAQELFYANRD